MKNFFHYVGNGLFAATQLWRGKIAKIAKDFRDVTFVIADEMSMQSKMAEFELSESSEDMNVGCYDADGGRYPMAPIEEFDADDIREFITKFKTGEISKIILISLN